VSDVLRRFHGLNRLFKVDEDAHVIFHEFGSEADGVLRRKSRRWSTLQSSAFRSRHLAETSGFDGVVNLAHRRMNAVHRDVADGQILVVVAVCATLAAAVLDAHFDLQLCRLR